jgi:hypothetical protein
MKSYNSFRRVHVPMGTPFRGNLACRVVGSHISDKGLLGQPRRFQQADNAWPLYSSPTQTGMYHGAKKRLTSVLVRRLFSSRLASHCRLSSCCHFSFRPSWPFPLFVFHCLLGHGIFHQLVLTHVIVLHLVLLLRLVLFGVVGGLRITRQGES